MRAVQVEKRVTAGSGRSTREGFELVTTLLTVYSDYI
jgi:hypothetical protein